MKHNKRKLLIIGSLVLLLLVAAGASVGLYFVFKPKNNGDKVPGRPTNVSISQTTDEAGYKWSLTWDPPSTGSQSNLGYTITYSGKVTDLDGEKEVPATGFPFDGLTTTTFDLPNGLPNVIFHVQGVNLAGGAGDWATVQGNTQKPFSLGEVNLKFNPASNDGVYPYVTSQITGITQEDLDSDTPPKAYLSILSDDLILEVGGKQVKDLTIPIGYSNDVLFATYLPTVNISWKDSYNRSTLWTATIVLKARGLQAEKLSSKVKIGGPPPSAPLSPKLNYEVASSFVAFPNSMHAMLRYPNNYDKMTINKHDHHFQY